MKNLILLIIVLACSCRSVQKTFSTTDIKKDSVAVTSSAINNVVVSNNKIDSSTSLTSINAIEVEFDGGDTSNASVIITYDSIGNVKVNPGKNTIKKIKAVKQQQANTNNIKSINTFLQKDSVVKDSVHVNTDINIDTGSRETTRFSLMWLWWLLIPIGLFAYYRIRKNC